MAEALHALVLAAGLGTRLDPLTRIRAKPAIPVAGDPMIRHIVRWLAAAGVTDVTVNLHHRPESIAAVLGDGSDLGVQVRYSWEHPLVLGSAGGPRQALDIIGADTVVIVNGDTLCDVDIAALVANHRRHHALITLALVPRTQPAQYRGILLDDQHRVRGIVPRGTTSTHAWHFVGVQVVEREVFAALEPGLPASTIDGIYDTWISTHPDRVRGWTSQASFWDLGTVADYWRTSHTWTADSRQGVQRTHGAQGRPAGGSAPRVAPSADVRDCIVWNNVTIDEHASLDECIVTDGVRVPEGRAYRRSILWMEDGTLKVEPLALD